eukprot:1417705-Prymnesium_polylepis.1
MRLIRSTAIMRQLQHAPSTTLSRFTGTSLVSGSRATYSTLSRLRKWLLESAALDLRHFLGLF